MADLPDSVTAAAAIAAATRTGPFKAVQAREVLTSERLADVGALARSTQGV